MTPQGKPIFSDLSSYPTLTPLERELLAALKAALPFIPHNADGARDVIHPTLSQARAAIAKAEGR